jgi:hypothetical protein
VEILEVDARAEAAGDAPKAVVELERPVDCRAVKVDRRLEGQEERDQGEQEERDRPDKGSGRAAAGRRRWFSPQNASVSPGMGGTRTKTDSVLY